jgi:hypothetical protein
MDPNDPVKCRKCGADVAIRINRNGFLQRSILGHFGIYPWKCGACGAVFLFRRRSLHPRSFQNSSKTRRS